MPTLGVAMFRAGDENGLPEQDRINSELTRTKARA